MVVVVVVVVSSVTKGSTFNICITTVISKTGNARALIFSAISYLVGPN